MVRYGRLSLAAALFVMGAPLSSPANALPTRTWVSGKGGDSGSCSLASPCRTFAYAITQTAAGGEIDVLDPAGYGALTITKAISIVNDGVGEAGVQAGSGADAITINAGTTDAVHLRGLTIEGAKIAANGVTFNTAGSLSVVNCVVRNFTNAGINIRPGAATLFFSTFNISDTLISDNGVAGVYVIPQSGGSPSGEIDRAAIVNNANGLIADGSYSASSAIKVTVLNSALANNAGAGVAATSTASGAGMTVIVRNSTAANNTYGLEATSYGVIRVGQTVATGNNTGVGIYGGTVYSLGDNIVDGNLAKDVDGSLSSAPLY
jgi:hypothetical protein